MILLQSKESLLQQSETSCKHLKEELKKTQELLKEPKQELLVCCEKINLQAKEHKKVSVLYYTVYNRMKHLIHHLWVFEFVMLVQVTAELQVTQKRLQDLQEKSDQDISLLQQTQEKLRAKEVKVASLRDQVNRMHIKFYSQALHYNHFDLWKNLVSALDSGYATAT